MKKNITLFAFVLLSFFYQKSFSQVTYPCGKYFIEMNGTTDIGDWSTSNLSGDFTLSAWVQLTDVTGKEMDIFSREQGGVAYFGKIETLSLYIAVDGHLKFRTNVTVGGVDKRDSVESGEKLQPFKWYHVAASFTQAGNCILYIDGNIAGTKDFGGPRVIAYPYTYFLLIGGKTYYFSSGYNFSTFKGYLDELAVAEKTLSQDQIRTLANGLPKGDPFLLNNLVRGYNKEDNNPPNQNSGIGGNNHGDFVSVVGTLHACTDPPISIIDPNPSIIKSDGTLDPTLNGLDFKNIVKGASTDGITKLLLVKQTKDYTPVTFTVLSAKGGTLSSFTNQSKKDPSVPITPIDVPGMGKLAIAIYNAPDGFGTDQPSNNGNRDAIITATNSANITIKLVSPPVVLVHGMWSDPSVWDAGGFSNKLFAKNFSVLAANYKKYNYITFNPKSDESIEGRRAVEFAIKKSLDYSKLDGIAATQVDVIGHSLGGLMTRSLSQQKEFTNYANYNKGYVHKLITLGTPHRGSPLGPELIASRTKKIFALSQVSISGAPTIIRTTTEEYLKYLGMPIGSCHTDFGRESAGIQSLKQTPPFYSYAITGNWQANGVFAQTAGYNLWKALLSYLVYKNFDEIFATQLPCNEKVLENDLVVPLSSQRGYIDKFTPFNGTAHSVPANVTETNNSLLQDKVIQLLLSDDATEFSQGFPAPSQFPLDCTTALQKQSNNRIDQTISKNNRPLTDSITQYIQIASPVKGAVFQQNSGKVIKFEFQTFGGALPTDALFMLEGGIGIPVTDIASHSVSFMLPNNTPVGSLNLILLAKDTTGIILGDTSHIIITADGIMDSLSVDPGTIEFDSSFRETSLYVRGYFINISGKVINDLSNGSTGTTYSSQKGATVFKVSKDGFISAVGIGTDTLIIANSGKIIKVPIIVNANFLNFSLYPSNIDFPEIPNKIITDGSFGITASTTSGQDVVFELVSGPVELQNGIVDIKGEGTVTIKASSKGNAYFTDPSPVLRTFVISNALPLTLVNFQGSAISSNEIKLGWQTAQEINTANFIIERSIDGNSFSSIGQVKASGNSSATISYSFTDLRPLNGTNFYRLKMVDQDGKFTYSKIIAIKVDDKDQTFRIFPNPAKEILYIQASGNSEMATIQVIDVAGRKLKEKKINLNSTSSFSIDLKDLPKGVYNILLKSKNNNDHQKFVKE